MKLIKKYTSWLVFALCVSVFPLTTAMTCSQSQQRVAYNTLSSVGSAVNTAFAAYNDQCVKGLATYNVSVAKAYNEFQAAFAIAVTSAQTVSAPAPQNIIDLANAVYSAIKLNTH